MHNEIKRYKFGRNISNEEEAVKLFRKVIFTGICSKMFNFVLVYYNLIITSKS